MRVRELLKKHREDNPLSLKQLLKDDSRDVFMTTKSDGILFDYTHQRVSLQTMELLFEFAKEMNLKEKIDALFSGKRINATEDRPVLHMALRGNKEDGFKIGDDFLNDRISKVLERIRELSTQIRNKKYLLDNGRFVKNLVVVGIGGSYLGAEAVYEALECFVPEKTERIKIKFLANVDPLAFKMAVKDIDANNTIAIIVSKTFTTSETMRNAKIIKNWFKQSTNKQDLRKHLFAVSSNLGKCADFGIPTEHVISMWEWVGGRFSVTSAVGVLPLSIAFGFDQILEFLSGARSMDLHFKNTSFDKNIPVLMALIGFWNSAYLKYSAHAIIPYSEALKRFPAHIQQVDMESNGKNTTLDSKNILETGEIVFGEPGTNAQHSFFQLLHQGRVVPIDLIGFCNCCADVNLSKKDVSSHEELMCNFFAQADALALGKESKWQHKKFDGNRPSLSLLFRNQSPYSIGQLISLYEHRIAAQGFLLDINSFDQFGVQLGKDLCKNVREKMAKLKFGEETDFAGMSKSVSSLIRHFVNERD